LFLGNRPVTAVVQQTMRRVLRGSRAEASYAGRLMDLVDDESASAAEVLVGALNDYQQAIIVGSKQTYGKGSVQKLHHLSVIAADWVPPLRASDREGVLKLSSSFFYSPLGHSPTNGGVKAQVVVSDENDKSTPVRRKKQTASELEPF